MALALIKAVFAKGLVKNKILEFIGPGVDELSVDFRGGIDVMTTETTCLPRYGAPIRRFAVSVNTWPRRRLPRAGAVQRRAV